MDLAKKASLKRLAVVTAQDTLLILFRSKEKGLENHIFEKILGGEPTLQMLFKLVFFLCR